MKSILMNPSTNTPIFLAGMETNNSGNPAYVRYRNLTTTEVEVFVQEEQSNDTETNHGREAISYAMFNEAGLIPDAFNNNIGEVEYNNRS